ncbi:hypothetical protein LCGC14_1541890 [marine sediment metagenome]|uniref:Uncharacterized protein n=1 Tax=marine sediment metagenome TaxID=412755 RepID=A0A0F9L8V4_9ZZZZ
MEKIWKIPLLIMVWAGAITLVAVAIIFIYGMILGATSPELFV